MEGNPFDGYLRGKSEKYPELFSAFRAAGWSEQWRADPHSLAREPYFREPFLPMHALARQLLERFGGFGMNVLGPRSLDFGCGAFTTARTLKIVRPYEVEEYLLGERGRKKTRPPAFPIGMMNDEMMFLREDWKTITVGYNWGWVMLTDDPFEAIDLEFRQDTSIEDDPARFWEITDPVQVPEHIALSIYLSV